MIREIFSGSYLVRVENVTPSFSEFCAKPFLAYSSIFLAHSDLFRADFETYYGLF